MTYSALIPVLVFAAFACGVFALLRLFDPQSLRIRSRVNELCQSGHGKPEPNRVVAVGPSKLWQGADTFLQYLVPYRTTDRTRLQRRLTKAGIYDSGALARFFTVKWTCMAIPLLLAMVAGFLGYLRMDTALLLGFAGGGIGSLVPVFWLDRTISKRQMSLHKSLPDLLDLMIICLEGGLSFQETIRRVGDELQLVHPTLAFELRIVQRDIELGASVDQALKRFANRTDYEAVRTLSTFIREAQRFGTNVTDALRNHADMLRSQREQTAEENAQKAAVKILLPTLLLIFPAIFVVLVGPAVIQIQEAFATK